MELQAARRLAASYDSGGYDPDHARHWAFADGASADVASSHEVRRTIRNRARYECLQNNSYGFGIIETLAQDTIGTGPRLQMHLPSSSGNAAVELEFRAWAETIRLADKLRTVRKSKLVDGEAVLKLVTNPPLPGDVKLDVQLIEADRLTAPVTGFDTERNIDGVLLDEYGNAVGYQLLDHHPGADYTSLSLLSYKTFSREQVIHFYRHDRPEQHRGVSELVTALPLFAFMRRYTLAVVAAAESCANHAMVLESEGPPFAGDDLTWEKIELQRNLATVLPANHKLGQIDPKQPATTYAMFKAEILNEVARCVSMPSNVARGDSSGYNYASGRLDHQTYDRALSVEQSCFEHHILDRLLGEWLLEAALIGLLPARVANKVLTLARDYDAAGVARRLPHSWEWDKRPHVDPSKEATAQRTRLQSGTTSRVHELQEAGLNIDEIDEQAARSFGTDLETYRQVLFGSLYSNGNMAGAAVDSGQPGDSEEPSEDEEPGEAEESEEPEPEEVSP